MSAPNGKVGPGEKFPILRRCSLGAVGDNYLRNRTYWPHIAALRHHASNWQSLAAELLAILVRR